MYDTSILKLHITRADYLILNEPQFQKTLEIYIYINLKKNKITTATLFRFYVLISSARSQEANDSHILAGMERCSAQKSKMAKESNNINKINSKNVNNTFKKKHGRKEEQKKPGKEKP